MDFTVEPLRDLFGGTVLPPFLTAVVEFSYHGEQFVKGVFTHLGF